MRRLLLLGLLCSTFACSGTIAGAAPVYVTLGQVDSSANALSAGGCTLCTAWQIASPGGVSYTFPYDGVITRWSVHTGQSVQTPPDTARARVFQLVDSGHAQLVAQGATTQFTTTNTNLDVFDRIPAAAGDVLGVEISSSNYIDDTRAIYYDGAASGEVAGFASGSLALGDSAADAGTDTRRVNISARFEHDTDRDGYGDGSQDLCTGDPAHTIDACSGTLFGSDLQGAHTTAGPCGTTYACTRVQTTNAGGASTAAPFDGVVVRWRLQAPAPGSYLVRILAPAAGGGYTITGSSDPVLIGSDEALWTFATRLPIPAGGYVALVEQPAVSWRYLSAPPAGATSAGVSDVATGPASVGTPTPGVLLYDADIEPDADHDGYGDVTQDACATDATTQGACAVAAPPGDSPPPPGGATMPPATARITSLRLRYASFRVAPHGRIVAARRVHRGSAIVVGMSAAATVRFAVRACRPRLRCTRSALVHRFTRTLKAGTTVIAYSGRYRAARRTRALRPGHYRLDATIVPGTGVTSRAFRVVR